MHVFCGGKKEIKTENQLQAVAKNDIFTVFLASFSFLKTRETQVVEADTDSVSPTSLRCSSPTQICIWLFSFPQVLVPPVLPYAAHNCKPKI